MQQAEAKALVSVQTMDAATRLVQGLLTCICDSVVKLDHELRLAEPCPALSTILLRDGPLTLGVQFTDLIYPEDRERFLSCLSVHADSGRGEEGQSRTRGRTFAGLCHVRLKHRLTSVLQVNLFFSSMAPAMGQASYLIGIQENSEEGHHDIPDAADGRCSGTSAAGDRLGSLPESFSKLMSHQNCSSLSGSDSGEEADMYVWVNAASATLTVLDSSSDFTLLAGVRAHCSALSEWLSPSDLHKVIALVQDPDQKSVDVRLITEKKWSYWCTLSIGAVQEIPAAPPSSKPVRLVVDRLVCKISKPSKKAGLLNSDLELWVSVTSDGRLHIASVEGGSRELANAFSAESDLCSWVEAATDFKKSLNTNLRQVHDEASTALPRILGVFTFRSPGHRPSRTRFDAQVTLLDIGRTNGTGTPLHFSFKRVDGATAAHLFLRDARATAGQGHFSAAL